MHDKEQPTVIRYFIAVFLLSAISLGLSACSEESADCPPEICQLEIPEPVAVQTCTPSDGVVLVPEPGFTNNVITLTEVEGTDDRYHLIFEEADLQLVSAGLANAGIEYDEIRAQVDGVLVLANEHGEGCANDTRTFLRMDISEAELADFITSSVLFEELMVSLVETFDKGIEDGITKILLDMGFDPDTLLDGINLVKFIAKGFFNQVAKLIVKIVAMNPVQNDDTVETGLHQLNT